MEYKKVEHKINDIINDNVKMLAQLFPSAVKDGEVDFEALKEELGEFQEVSCEKYELTWAGKQNAKKIAQEDLYGKTLKFIPEESKNIETTENLYIEGDNLEVLKLLRQNYYGAIKMIYIDPPYNTGNDFIYNDKFLIDETQSEIEEGHISEYGERYVVNSKSQNRYHANWLNMLYPRIRIAKDFIKEDGVFFMSIGEEELSNAKAMCDEIFGENNNITIISRVAKTASNMGTFFAPSMDYILCYAKDITTLTPFKGDVDESLYTKVEEKGNRVGEKYRDDVALYQASLTLERSRNARYFIDCPDGSKCIPPEGKRWRVVEETILEMLKNDMIVFKETKTSPLLNQDGEKSKWNLYTKSYLKDRQDSGTLPRNYFDQFINRKGADQLKTFDIKFDFAKPTELIKYLCKIINDDNAIVMDFFSGSATTAHAVMQLNKEDNGTRKFIMVQLAENIEDVQFNTICELGRARIDRTGEKLLENTYTGLDIGFKTFRVENSNIKWNKFDEVHQQITTETISYKPDLMDFVLGAKDFDIVYELMLRQKDVPLSVSIEQLNGMGERTYLYASSYLVCLESQITKEIIDKLSELNPLPIKFIFRDSAFGDDIALKDETFRRLKALIEKNAGSNKITYTVEFI